MVKPPQPQKYNLFNMNLNQKHNQTLKSATWKQGKHWFDDGLKLFNEIKNHWFLLCFTLAALLFLLSHISLNLVSFLMLFVSPVFTALVLMICQQFRKSQPISVASAAQQVMTQLNSLLALGVITVLLGLLLQQMNLQILYLMGLPVEVTKSMLENMSNQEVFTRSIVNFLSNLPLALALAFSPALIVFNRHRPLQAVWLSVKATIKAWKAFVVLSLLFILTVFGVLLLSSLVFAVLTTVIGAASQFILSLMVLILIAVIAGLGLCAQYMAYLDIFMPENEEENNDTQTTIEL